MTVRRFFTHALVPTLIASLLLCGFFVSSTLHCSTGSQSNQLVGHACSAESMTTPTIWSWQEQHLAIQSREQLLILVVTLLLTGFAVQLIPQRVDGKGKEWMRAHLLLQGRRAGPLTVFIPALHATHGW